MSAKRQVTTLCSEPRETASPRSALKGPASTVSFRTSNSPPVTVHVATCARDRTPSLFRMCSTCVSTVRSEMTSRSAMSRFVRPSATKAATSRSRLVSPLACIWSFSPRRAISRNIGSFPDVRTGRKAEREQRLKEDEMTAPRAFRASFLAFWTVAALVVGACGGSATPTLSASSPTVAPTAAPATAAAKAYTPANSVPQDFQWAKAPAAYPAGAEIVVLEGDLTKPVPFTLRFRFPDGYALPPHQHPIDEHVTVIQGTFVVGMGTSGKRETAVEMPTGSV